MNKVTILKANILNITRDELLKSLDKGILLTPNVDHLVKLQKDNHFNGIYQKSDWVICDSKVVYWGAKFLGTPIKEVIPGSSFFPDFCDYHRENPKVKIFLLGAGPNIANVAMENINSRIGRNIITGAHSPSMGFEKNEEECLNIVKLINNSDASVLVVGVGAPKQEKWIYKYKSMLPNINIFMALGATIDFEAGNIKRAPKIFRVLTLEWFYRMLTDPKRLVKRYLFDDMPFFYYLFGQKISSYFKDN